MTEYRCIVPGCLNVFKTDELVSSNFTYICSGRASYGDDILLHTREEQIVATGRKYNPNTDEADRDIHFQSGQFDKDLRRAYRPEGTDHIPNQGSDILQVEDIYTEEEE
jgi:hypothetical protein